MLVYLEMLESPEERTKLEVLYTHYRSLMYRIAYDILRNDRDAEDAVHNAFLTVAENMQKIGKPKCPKTTAYIVTITESRAIDLYRKKKRCPETSLEQLSIGVQTDYTGGSALFHRDPFGETGRILSRHPKRMPGQGVRYQPRASSSVSRKLSSPMVLILKKVA